MMQKYLLVVVVVLLVVIGSAFYFYNVQTIVDCLPETLICPDGSSVGRGGPRCEFAPCPGGEEGVIVDDIEAFKEHEAAMGKDKDPSAAEFFGIVLAGSKALLIDYNKLDYERAIISDKLVVLYFYTNWCPICKKEFPEMQAAFNDLATDRVIGFRVNYDDDETDADEKALAKEFGVPYQHTKVFLKNAERILKAPDGWDKARYISEINKALGQ